MPSPARSRLKDATESTPTLDDYRCPGWTATSFLGVGIFTTRARPRWSRAAVLEAGPGYQRHTVTPSPPSLKRPAAPMGGCPLRLYGECRCKESSACQRQNGNDAGCVPERARPYDNCRARAAIRACSASGRPQDLRRRRAMIAGCGQFARPWFRDAEKREW
jgi:hypothetical protein